MNEIFTLLAKFSRVVGKERESEFYTTVLQLVALCAKEVEDKNTAEFKDFLNQLNKFNTKKVKVTNLKEKQKIRGEVEMETVEIKDQPKVEIDKLNLEGKKRPEDWLTIRISTGEHHITPLDNE